MFIDVKMRFVILSIKYYYYYYPSNTPILWPTPLTTPNGIQIQSAIFPQFTNRRQTDRRSRQQLCSNIRLCSIDWIATRLIIIISHFVKVARCACPHGKISSSLHSSSISTCLNIPAYIILILTYISHIKQAASNKTSDDTFVIHFHSHPQ